MTEKTKTIAIDFDGTICENKWPDIGTPNIELVAEAIREQENGAQLILWTCREGLDLIKALAFCSSLGLNFDAVNDNTEDMKRQFGNNCRKVNADEYWDDKAVNRRYDAGNS